MSKVKQFLVFIITLAIPHSAFKMKVGFCVTAVCTPKTMFPNRERDALELGFCSPVGRKSFTNAGLEAAFRHLVAYIRLTAKRQSPDKCRHYVDLLSRRSAKDLVPFLYAASERRPSSSCVARSCGRVEFGAP